MSEIQGQIDACAHWDGRELSYATSKRGLLEFVSILRSECYGVYQLKRKSSFPDCITLASIEIKLNDDRLLLTVDNQWAILSGNKVSLSLLADNLEFLRLQWSKNGNQHLHFDPSSNPFLLSPNSEAFVVGATD